MSFLLLFLRVISYYWADNFGKDNNVKFSSREVPKCWEVENWSSIEICCSILEHKIKAWKRTSERNRIRGLPVTIWKPSVIVKTVTAKQQAFEKFPQKLLRQASGQLNIPKPISHRTVKVKQSRWFAAKRLSCNVTLLSKELLWVSGEVDIFCLDNTVL